MAKQEEFIMPIINPNELFLTHLYVPYFKYSL